MESTGRRRPGADGSVTTGRLRLLSTAVAARRHRAHAVGQPSALLAPGGVPGRLGTAEVAASHRMRPAKRHRTDPGDLNIRYAGC